MSISLGIMAGIIFFTYSLYFSRIIKGSPQEFEMDILKALGGWIIVRGMASRRSLWMLLYVSLIIEILYFGFTLLVIDNLAMQFITGLAVGLEIFHMGYMGRNLSRFFKGKIALKEIFGWRLERISALLFFTHSFLVLVFLITY
jgi:hypothetical protein